MYKKPLDAFIKNSKNNMNSYSNKIIAYNMNNYIYNDKDYPTCNTCNGSGYIKNFLNEMSKKNFDIKNKYKDNLENSAFCWNCGYEFPDQITHAAHGSGNWWSSFFVTLIFIGAFVVLVLIIIDAIR